MTIKFSITNLPLNTTNYNIKNKISDSLEKYWRLHNTQMGKSVNLIQEMFQGIFVKRTKEGLSKKDKHRKGARFWFDKTI